MITSRSVYNSEEFSRRGKELYARIVCPALRPEHKDQFVAIDIQSSDYEIDQDDFTATERLLKRHPHAQIWLARVDQKAAYRIGGFS